MQIMELNHVAIQVRDVERSCAFYRDVLGLQQIERPAFSFPGAWFSLGPGQELHIIGEADRPAHGGPRSSHFALRVRSIREAEEALKAKGIPIHGPWQRPDGAWQLFLSDPDGHFIELCELPDSSDS